MILNRKKNRNNGGENARYKSKLGAEEAATLHAGYTHEVVVTMMGGRGGIGGTH